MNASRVFWLLCELQLRKSREAIKDCLSIAHLRAPATRLSTFVLVFQLSPNKLITNVRQLSKWARPICQKRHLLHDLC